MPRYYPKKPTQVETMYELETSKNKYLLTTRESESSVMIYIGGIDTYCLECQIIKENAVANLPKIIYDEKCSLTGKFERGTDTLMLMTLLVNYVKEKYTYVSAITFDDYSTRECTPAVHIELAPFYFVFHEKTWYMDRMDAYVFDPVEKDDFITKTNKFQEAKKETSWEQYDSMVTTKHPLPESEMRALYDSSETWLEFFNALKSAMKKDMHALCLYMYPWITSFVQTVAKLKFTSIQFAIPVNKFVNLTRIKIWKRKNH